MLKWHDTKTELTWGPASAEAEYERSVLDRPKMLTLVAQAGMASALIQQAPTSAPDGLGSESRAGPALGAELATVTGAHALVSDTSMSTAAIAEAATSTPDTAVSSSELSDALTEQAGTSIPITLVPGTAAGKVDSTWQLEGFSASLNDDNTATITWGADLDRGPFYDEDATSSEPAGLVSVATAEGVNIRSQRIPVLDSAQVNGDNSATINYSVPGTDPFDFPK